VIDAVTLRRLTEFAWSLLAIREAPQVASRQGDHRANGLQAVRPRKERKRGLMIPNLRLQNLPVVLGHVRGIRDDQVEQSVDRRKQRALGERHPPLHAVAPGIAACDGKRLLGEVGGDNAGTRELTGERDGEAPAPGADIEDAIGAP